MRAVDAAGNTSNLSQAIFVTTAGSSGNNEIAGYYFETGLDGWTDGGTDCRRTNNASRAFEGSFSMRLRDGSATSFTESPEIDLSGNTEVTIAFHTYSISMDLGEYYVVDFYNGSTYQTIGTYERAVDFNNGVFFTDTIILDSATYNFTTNNRFRFTNFADDDKDRVYLDAIVVSGDNATPFNNDNNTTALKSFNANTDNNVRLYPNPANSVINIEILEGQFDEIVMFSSLGKVLYIGEKGVNNMSIDISHLASGMYFVRFVSNGKATTKRFVKE